MSALFDSTPHIRGIKRSAISRYLWGVQDPNLSLAELRYEPFYSYSTCINSFQRLRLHTANGRVVHSTQISGMLFRCLEWFCMCKIHNAPATIPQLLENLIYTTLTCRFLRLSSYGIYNIHLIKSTYF